MRFCYDFTVDYSEFNCILLCYSKESFADKNLFHSTVFGNFILAKARFIFIHHGTDDIPYFIPLIFAGEK